MYQGLRGTIVALPTPFENDRIDLASLEAHIEFLLDAGVRGLSPGGTTGEAPVLTQDEHRHLIETTVRVAAGKVPIVAGTGSNSTAKTLELTRVALGAGADAALVVTPYYNRPNPEGMYRHFMTLSETVELPIVLYSVPSRTGCELDEATVARLAANGNILALKEAGGCVDRVTRIARACPDLCILSGDDSLTLPMLSVGAVGTISVVANLAPQTVEEMIARFQEGDVSRARELHHRLDGLTRALFAETNPVPLKAALCRLGAMTDEVRLPLAPASSSVRDRLDAELEAAGVSSRPAISRH